MEYLNKEHEQNLEVQDLISAIWNNRILVVSFTTLSIVISIIVALSLPNYYQSSAVLAPVDDDNSLQSQLSSLSGLASISGINIPKQSVDKSSEALKRLESFKFFSEHFLPYINLEDLLAVEKWIPKTNKVIYKENLFKESTKTWVRRAAYPKKKIPSDQEAYKKFRNIITIAQDNKTQFIFLSLEHKSPFIAKQWMDILIDNINKSMREKSEEEVIKSIIFLNENLQNAKLSEVKEAIARLLETQIKNQMLISSNEDYVLKIIDSPIVPEEKFKPRRAIICISGTIFGFLLSIIFSLISHLRSTRFNDNV